MTGIFHFVCDFLYTAVRIWGTRQLMEAVSKPRWGKKYNTVWFVTVLMLSGLNAYNDSLISSLFSNSSMMIIILLLSLVCASMYGCRYRNAFCMVFLVWTGMALADFFFQTIVCVVLIDTGAAADILLTATLYRSIYLLLCSVFFHAVVRFACRKIKEKGCGTGRYRKWGWLSVLPLLLCLIYFQRVYKLLVSGQVLRRWWLFLSGGLLVFLFVGGYLFIQKRKERGRLLRLRMNMMECDYRELLKIYEEKEILLHDIKKHMQAIRGMAEEGRNQEILCYLDEMNGVLQKGRNRNLVNHDLVNLILNQKFREAEDAGISLRYEMTDLSGLLLKPTEVCALFSNVLDNAIEANLKNAEDTERWINLICMRKEQLLIVFIANPMAEKKIRYAGGIPETTKQDKREHGFGMRSIRQVVKLHDGHMLIETENEIFSLTVCLKGFSRNI